MSRRAQDLIFGNIPVPPWLLPKEIEGMPDREKRDARDVRVPEHMIEAINELVRTSRQMFLEIGREPTPEELAERLTMPLRKVLRLLEIAKRPISLNTAVAE